MNPASGVLILGSVTIGPTLSLLLSSFTNFYILFAFSLFLAITSFGGSNLLTLAAVRFLDNIGVLFPLVKTGAGGGTEVTFF